MYFTYILKSQKTQTHYIGSCTDINERLQRHNSGRNRSTKSGKPWNVIHTELFATRTEAIIREHQIKSYKGGNAFKKLINHGEVA